MTTVQPAADGPREGAPLLVVGVVPPDTLNVRAAAGADSEVVVERFLAVAGSRPEVTFPMFDDAEFLSGNASADHLVVDLLHDRSGSEAGDRLDVYYLLSEDDGSYEVRDVTETTLCRRSVDLAGACT